MSADYTFELTNGIVLGTIYSLENNGPGARSVPRQILDIDLSTSPPTLLLADDLTARFTSGFSFDIVDSVYSGTYQVGPSGSSLDANFNTLIPLSPSTPLQQPAFPIVAVVTGLQGKFYTTGAINGASQFYPTSQLTVAGNSLPVANTTYNVLSSATSANYTIQNITTGVGTSSIVFAGDRTEFFQPGFTFVITGNGLGDGQYTTSTATFSSGVTTVVPIETISNGATINGFITPNPTITSIQVTTSIPGGTGSNGTVTPQATTFLALSAPPSITPTTPNTFLVTWYVTGDHTPEISVGSVIGIKGNNYFNYKLLEVSNVSYISLAGFTAITTEISAPVTPMITQSGGVVLPPPAVPLGFIRYSVPGQLTTLKLVGRGCPSYDDDTTWGQAVQDNHIHLLENFANTTSPSAPLIGQLWYDTSTDILRIYTSSSSWSSVAFDTSSVCLRLDGTNGMTAPAVAFGLNATANASTSTALGKDSITNTPGEIAMSSGSGVTVGSRKTSIVNLWTRTTNATTTTLGSQDGTDTPLASTALNISPSSSPSTHVIKAYVTGTRMDVVGTYAAWEITALVTHAAGTITLVGSPTITSIGSVGAPAWTVNVGVTGTLVNVQVTGTVGQTVKWTGSIILTS